MTAKCQGALPWLLQSDSYTPTATDAAELKAYFEKYPQQLKLKVESSEGLLLLHWTTLVLSGKHVLPIVASLLATCPQLHTATLSMDFYIILS